MNNKLFNSTKTPLVAVENLSFAYESLNSPLLSNLTFNLYHNETTVLLGASGSGKSSLALCLNGLYPEAVEGKSSGDILFNGKHLKEFQPGEINQQIGVVFQDPEAQFCMIHVEDELAFTLENMHVPVAEMPGRITEVLELVGMEAYKKRKLHELSGGEQQKIALAAVLLLEPALLILDEATVNLDPVSAEAFIELIGSIQEEREIGVLIIDHQVDDWLPYTDRVLVLGQEGNLIADEKPAFLFTDMKPLLKKEGIFIPCIYEPDLQYTWPRLPIHAHPVLTLENIHFKRNKRTIMDGIDIEICGGEFVAIVGRNGAGKSTLLEMMAGILKPTKGKVNLHGQALSKWSESELRKRMGFVFQNPEHQFITDTVYEELTFGMKLHDYPKEKIQQSASTLLKQFQLEEQRFHNPFALSGGQKRRLSVATTLDETPEILLFDEPTFGQDAETTKRLMDMMFQLKEKGIAIVFVTHDMKLTALADRVLVLNEQQIVFNGRPESLWEEEMLLKEARLRLPIHIRNKPLEVIV